MTEMGGSSHGTLAGDMLQSDAFFLCYSLADTASVDAVEAFLQLVASTTGDKVHFEEEKKKKKKKKKREREEDERRNLKIA